MSQNINKMELEDKAKIFSLFGDNTRIKILKLLYENKECNVSQIADSVGMSVACISHHLQLLRDNKILKSKREGNSIYYSLTDNEVIKKLRTLII